MSKDMLGSLVRASVNLSQGQVNLSLDVMNRFTGKDSAAWEAHIKSVLRSGLPSQTKQPEATKPSVLHLANDSVKLDAVEAHDPQAYFKTGSGLWVSDEFQNRILSKAKPVKELPVVIGKSYDLLKNAYDRQITAELGESYKFVDESELCARISAMIAKQRGGKEGDLLNNGYANLFYVAGYVVRVYWDSGYREWHVDAWELGDGRWGAGSRAFSRN